MSKETKVKSSVDVPNLGSDITFNTVDGKLQSVVIKNPESGDYIVIQKENSYSEGLIVLTQEKPKIKTVYVLSGKFLGVADFREQFDTMDKATHRLDEINIKYGDYSDINLDVTTEEVEYFEDKI